MKYMNKTQVVHYKYDHYDEYCGRPGPWGNPYSNKPSKVTGTIIVKTKEEAIEKYLDDLLRSPDLLNKVLTLKGKRLACWCKRAAAKNIGLVCHCQVLAYLAEHGIDPLPSKEEILRECVVY